MSGQSEIVGITTMGEKGQVVIPANVRQALGLVKGEKLAVICKGKEGICLVRLSEMKRFAEIISKTLKVAKFK